MASSTRVQFSKSEIERLINETHDARVQRKCEERDRLLDIANRHEVWRAAAENRVLVLARRLEEEPDDVSDSELQSLRIPDAPKLGIYEKPEEECERQIEKLGRIRDAAWAVSGPCEPATTDRSP